MMEKPNNIVWLAVQVKATPADDRPYPLELIGVFTNCDEAVQACREPTDCVGPMELGTVQPREMVEWQGAFYPLQEFPR